MRTRRDIPLSHTVSYGPIRRLLSDGEKPRISMFFTFYIISVMYIYLRALAFKSSNLEDSSY